MFDSNSNKYLTDGQSGDAVKPEIVKSQKSEEKLSSALESKLETCRIDPFPKQRSSSRLDDRKTMEDMVKDISYDFANLC